MKWKILLLLMLLIMPVMVNAHTTFYKDITITFNHDGCDQNTNKEVTVQLFADNKKVEGEEYKLNKSNNFTHKFENLNTFRESSGNEIKYDVRILEDGAYRLISESNYKFEKGHVARWVQIMPEDIKPDHTYVFTTENWNYGNNGAAEILFLKGDIKSADATLVPDYKIINGKPSYYSIEGEPAENTKWVTAKVPTNDPEYNEFKDYLVFTNEGGKKLTLTGYRNFDDSVYWIFKYSGRNGYIEEENALYSNKAKIIPIEDSRGKFYIGSHNTYPEPNNKMQYINTSGNASFFAGSNKTTSAQFKAFEYVESDVYIGTKINVNESLCGKDTVVINKNAEVTRNIHVNFDCTECEEKQEKGVTIQLFADGKKVEDGEKKLTKKTGFDYTYANLPVFHDESTKKIEYEVKALIDGNYYSLPQENTHFKSTVLKKWIQALPSDVEDNHTYLLITNSKSDNKKFVYLRGDVKAKTASVTQTYNIVDGKEVFYELDGDPLENTKWVITDGSPGYSILTNETGKRLTYSITNYNGTDHGLIIKYSGKTGYVEADNIYNVNNVKIIPADNSYGGFYIGTDEVLGVMTYVYIDGNNDYKGTTDITKASVFRFYEYVEKEASVAGEMIINPSLCSVLELAKNPETGNKITIFVLIAIISMLTTIVLLQRSKKIKMTS